MNITKSMAMQEKAKKLIPGMTQLLSKRPDMFSYGVWPGYFSRAKGVDIWDLDGNHYVDMSIGGIGANVLGYADADVDNAVRAAIDAGNSSSLNCPEEIELAELLCTIHPWAKMVRYARTGGESMTIAVRIARAYKGRDKIAFCGYHGWHDWYLAANLGTENALGEHLIAGLSPAGVPRGLTGTALPFRYNHLEDLQEIVRQHKDDLAAIVMEPIRNQKPQNGFLDGVREIADKSGAVLIIDEISAGLRMNSGGAHLVLGIEPDIAVFSKALGNGYPMAAIIGKREVMETVQRTFISSTYWTERIGPTAALATLKKHQSLDVGSHLMEIGQLVQDGWINIAQKNNLKIEVGGIPPLSHFAFEYEQSLSLKALYIQIMLEKGFLASTLFYAMYAHEKYHVEQYIGAADEAMAEIRQILDKDDIEKYLQGKPACSGFKRLA